MAYSAVFFVSLDDVDFAVTVPGVVVVSWLQPKPSQLQLNARVTLFVVVDEDDDAEDVDEDCELEIFALNFSENSSIWGSKCIRV